MINKVGMGKIKVDGDKLVYNGTFPICDDGDELFIFNRNDLEKMINEDVNLLLACGDEMPLQMYRIKDGEDPCFVNELVYTAGDGSNHKLFLDRNFYSNNFKDMIFVRYVSVDQSLMEEEGK